MRILMNSFLFQGKMGRFCPWSTKHIAEHVESKYLQAFSHFTYKYTNGELVACDFQGIYDPNSSKYIFTDSSIHSTFKMYGLFDEGQNGISEFFKLHKCNDICDSWPTPTPLTPPPSFEAACMLRSNLAPASAFENIVFPADSSENVASGFQDNSRVDVGERRRHSSERHRQLQRQAESSLNGRSFDLNDSHRRMNVSSESVVMTRGDVSGRDTNLPPSYEDLLPTLKTNNNPPPLYDSLVNPGGISNTSTHDLNSRRQSGNPKRLRNGRGLSEVNKNVSSRQRSATDPLMLLEDVAEHHETIACGASCILNSPQGNQNLPFGQKCTSNPVFYCDEAISQSCIPSAPPEEDEDISGT
uniref:Alpha-type protein kinase domain-containing protein n=1 Tax=Arion vulgaris TaxID=1028688 RepID=A0A0B6ZKH2_9EUPU